MNYLSGDPIAADEFARLIRKWNIFTAIETGTASGGTTQYLASLCGYVWTAELERTNEYRNAEPRINALYGRSPEILEKIGQYRPNGGEYVFFFLDAHNSKDGSPLLQELQVIAKYWLGRAVIAIHDFKVPGKSDKELRWDTYGTQALEWDYVKADVEKIYPSGFNYHYNEKAEGAKVGIVYIEPNQDLGRSAV